MTTKDLGLIDAARAGTPVNMNVGPQPDGRVRSRADVIHDFRERYTWDVGLFAREVLAMDPEPWQNKVNDAYDAREPRISIKSGHGVGKTTELAVLVLHHNLFRYPQKTAITAPSTSQLFDALWPEIGKWRSPLPKYLFDLLDQTSDRIVFRQDPENSFTSAKTSRADQPEAMQGVHSDWVLLVVDEASGVPEAVFEAASGSMSGANVMTILTGNPVRGQGFFFDTHGRNKDLWWTLTVTVFDSKWSGGQAYADQIARTYGENSNAYRVRVMGEFPTVDDDTVISFEMVESSLNREVEPLKVRAIWGVDVAHMGSDRSTLVKRRGNVLVEPPKAWNKLEPDEVAARIFTDWQHTPESERPIAINVDLIGFGTGVVASLRALGLPARGVNVAETAATNADAYRNLRTELYFKGREWFQQKDVRFPKPLEKDDNMDQLIRELTMVRYRFTPQSRKLYLESKDDIRKRGFRSPDLADAFVLTFAGDAITLAQGGKAAFTNWRHPIARPSKTLR